MRFPTTHGPGCSPANDGHCRLKRERLIELAEMADFLAQHFLDVAAWLRTTPPGVATDMPLSHPERYDPNTCRCVDEQVEKAYAAATIPTEESDVPESK